MSITLLGLQFQALESKRNKGNNKNRFRKARSQLSTYTTPNEIPAFYTLFKLNPILGILRFFFVVNEKMINDSLTMMEYWNLFPKKNSFVGPETMGRALTPY